jgi:uncharacterized protein (TIGR03083 family)
MQTLTPLRTLDLFPQLDHLLIDLLNSLQEHDWQRATLAKQWSVKDVAAHLLQGTIQGLTHGRDGYFSKDAPASSQYNELVNYINKRNANWIQVMGWVSPAVLTDLLKKVLPQYYQYLSGLDPHTEAAFPVSWAGEEVSKNWFHIAREYTEKWHHQQQIRQAVNRTAPLYASHLYEPVIDTFMRGLPHHYSSFKAPKSSLLEINITGMNHRKWLLLYEKSEWQLLAELNRPVDASITIPYKLAWKIFTKATDFNTVKDVVHIEGREELALHLLKMVSVTA